MGKSLPSVMEHSFSRVPQARLPRSSFRRPFRHVTTMDEDYLYPLFTDEQLPGDTFTMDLNAVARMITPETPFMDNLYLDCFFFFVPNRIVQTNWVKLQGEQDNPADSIDYSTPYITTPPSTGFANETIWDYLGVPTQVPDLRVDTHLHRGYNLIWNEWFRDQNLQDSVTVDAGLKRKQEGVQENIEKSTNPISELGDFLMESLGGDGKGGNTGQAVHQKSKEIQEKIKQRKKDKWEDWYANPPKNRKEYLQFMKNRR